MDIRQSSFDKEKKAAALKIVGEAGDVNHLALVGRLDVRGVYSVEIQFQEYIEANRKHTIVDLSEVTDIRSVGMRMLLNGRRILKEAGAKMVILKPSWLVEEGLRTACLDQVMPITRDLKEALRLFR